MEHWVCEVTIGSWEVGRLVFVYLAAAVSSSPLLVGWKNLGFLHNRFFEHVVVPRTLTQNHKCMICSFVLSLKTKYFYRVFIHPLLEEKEDG